MKLLFFLIPVCWSRRVCYCYCRLFSKPPQSRKTTRDIHRTCLHRLLFNRVIHGYWGKYNVTIWCLMNSAYLCLVVFLQTGPHMHYKAMKFINTYHAIFGRRYDWLRGYIMNWWNHSLRRSDHLYILKILHRICILTMHADDTAFVYQVKDVLNR